MTGTALVDIYSDCGASIGYGHIRRARTLAAHLERSGFDVRCVGLSDAARRLLPPPEPGAESRVAAIAVFDAPAGVDALMREAAGRGVRTAALDWFGETVPDVNVVVYPHQAVRSKLAAYVGFEYILVRDEIARLAARPAATDGHVLVVLGGGDLLGQGHEAARRLCAEGLDVTLVQGPLARDTHAAGDYRVVVNPPDLPERLAACDWAVTNGGGCFFEACCLGKAAVVLPQTDAEARIARYAQERGAVLGVGLDALRRPSGDATHAVGLRGRALVDGRGGERLCGILKGLL